MKQLWVKNIVIFLFCFSGQHSPETIELEINTGSSEGLILWQGVVSPGRAFRLSNLTEARFNPHFKTDTYTFPLTF